jgi:hypothetical protein
LGFEALFLAIETPNFVELLPTIEVTPNSWYHSVPVESPKAIYDCSVEELEHMGNDSLVPYK